MHISKIAPIIAALALTLAGQAAFAVTTGDYMVITSMDSGDGHAFLMSDSKIGSSTTGGGITLDGDAAITNDGTVSFSNSEVHSVNMGPSNAGSQGVDCSSSFNSCTDNGSQIESSNLFNQSAPVASYTDLDNNNGIQGLVDLSGVTTQLSQLEATLYGLGSTGSQNVGGGTINTNTTWDYSGNGNQLNVIDINTFGNDFSITGSDLTIMGDAGDTIIFRVNAGWVMDMSQANILLAGGLSANNLMFLVDSDEGEVSFTFDNVMFSGAMWDIDSDDVKNIAHFNNVDFCGQVVTDGVNFQNTFGSACTFNVSAVPIPAAAWLFGSALLGLGAIKRRKV